MDGDPPDLPSTGYSNAARNFVSSCLHKVPKMRPTYAMLLRHPWLESLMKPPTITEEEEEEEEEAEAEAALEADADAPSTSRGTDSRPETADREIAEWVRSALQRKINGTMRRSDKPALHAAPLDAVPGSPLLDREGLKLKTSSAPSPDGPVNGSEAEIAAAAVADSKAVADPELREGVTVESPELDVQCVHSMDFADGVQQPQKALESQRPSVQEDQAQAQAPAPTANSGHS